MPDVTDQYGVLYERSGSIESLRSYLLSIFIASVICAIVTKLAGEKGSLGVLTKLIAGLVMTVTLVRPLVTVRLTDLTQWSHEFDSDAARAVALGQTQTRKALAEFIIQRTQAYILDKAQALNTALEVEVTLSDDEIPIPVKVRLSGKVSPYAKGRLQQIISEELGIERENQIWT